MSQTIIMTYINIANFVLINWLGKDHSMIETCRLKDVVIFMETILCFELWNSFLHYLVIIILQLLHEMSSFL